MKMELIGNIRSMVTDSAIKLLEEYYDKSETDELLDTKMDVSDLDGKANVSDVYDKSETDNLLDGKANVDDVYTKTEIDDKLGDIETILEALL